MAKRTIDASIKLDGEPEFNKSMKEINARMRMLSSQMNLAESDFRGQANSIEALKAKGDKLAEMYELQKSKVIELELALEKSNAKYGENSTQSMKLVAQLNNAKAGMNDMSRALEENTRLQQEAENSTDGLATSIDEYGNKTKDAADKTDSFGNIASSGWLKAGKALVASELVQRVTDVVKKLAELTDQAAAFADEVLTVSVQTGIDTGTLQEYYYAAELIDVSVDTMTSAMRKNIRAMSDAQSGSANAVEAYEKLGVAVTDSNGRLRDSETVFWEVIDALGRMNNETERDATAMELLGRSATDLNTLIEAGSEKMAELGQEARNVGYVLDEGSLQTLGDMDDATQRLNNSWQAFKSAVAVNWAPLFAGIKNGLADTLGFFARYNNVSNLNRALASGEIDAAEYQEQINGIVNSLDQYKASAQDAADATEKLSDAEADAADIAPTAQQQANALDFVASKTRELMQAYQEAYTAAYDSVRGQTGLFQMLETNVSTSVEDMMDALESQAEYYSNYAANLSLLGQWGFDQGIMDRLSDGSAESVAYAESVASRLKSMLNGLDGIQGAVDLVSTMNAKYQESEQAMSEYAATVADMTVGVPDQFASLLEEAQSMAQGMDLSEQMRIAAQNTIDGYLQGLDASAIKSRMAQMAEEVMGAFNSSMGIFSPSRRMRDSAKWTLRGFTDEISRGERAISESMGSLADVGMASFNERRLAIPAQPVSHQVTVTTNVYPRTLDAAQTDYLVNEVNRQLGGKL